MVVAKLKFLISLPEFDTCLLSKGKQHQSHCSFDVRRCLISQALSFIFIFWHLKTPHQGAAKDFVLNYFMVRIGNHQPGNSPDGEEKGSFLSVSATGHITDESLRIEGFSSVKRGQDHRV